MKAALQYVKGDRAIWLVVLLLALASVLLVYSSIVTLAYNYKGGNSMYYLFRHSFFLIAGVGIIYFVHRLKYHYFSRIAQLALYIAIPLLALTLMVGVNINHASRWLYVFGYTFQTSDFAKLALIMYVARILAIRQNDIGDYRKAFLPIVIPMGIVCGLILPADLSTAAMLFVSCLVLMFIGRIPAKQLLALVGMAIVGLALIYATGKALPGSFDRLDTWTKRIEAFFAPGQVSSDSNYQVEQSKIAIATGGITGKGPGNSTQRNFLPHPYSDFIFAIVLEEYGLMGGAVILLLYLILLFRAVRISIVANRTFGAFLAIGISFILVFQALINMAVAVNLLPVTGQPLPLVSMGGTSIWLTCAAIGVILSVSHGIEEEATTNNPKRA